MRGVCVRGWWVAMFLAGCPGDGGLAEQLIGLGVAVDGRNVLHGTVAEPGGPTDLGPVPLIQDDHLFDGFVTLGLVGGVSDWAIELVGDDPAFTLVTDGMFLEGLWCLPPAVDEYHVDLVVTAASQPGREFRVGFACRGDDAVRRLPLHADEVGAGQTFAGRIESGADAGALAVAVGDALPEVVPGLSGAAVARGGVLDDGRLVVVRDRAVFVVDPDGGSVQLASEVGDATRVRVDPVAQAAWFSDRSAVHQVPLDGGDVREFSVSARPPQLVWVTEDGGTVLANSGPVNGQWWIHQLDVASGEAREVALPGVERITEPAVALSADRGTLYQLLSTFGEVALFTTDLGTGERTDLAERAVADLRARRAEGVYHVSDLSFTPDLSRAALVFDNVQPNPADFSLRGSWVYVIDTATGRTWLASVLPDGEPIPFAFGALTGRLLEHVRIAPDGESVVFGRDYVSSSAAWVEVP